MGWNINFDHCSIQNPRIGSDVFQALEILFGKGRKVGLGLEGV